MTAIALLRFRQGANIGAGGHALVVAISGTAVTIENTSNIDVASYRIELLYAPPDSTTYPITPGVSAPIELAVGNGFPTATLNVSEAGIYGCYRIRLTVWPLLNQGGVPDVDIRNIAVVTPGFGIILPPYQKFPGPLPLEGAGSKLDELNFAGQARGWAGPAYHAVTYPWRLLHSALKALIPAAPVSVGSANAEGSAATVARSDHVHAHGDQAGGTLHAGGTETTAGFITAAQVTTLNNAFNASDLPQWRTVLDTDFGALGDLGPFSTNDPITLGGVTWTPVGVRASGGNGPRIFDIVSGVGLRWRIKHYRNGSNYYTNSEPAMLGVSLASLDTNIKVDTPLRLHLLPGSIADAVHWGSLCYQDAVVALDSRYGAIPAGIVGHSLFARRLSDGGVLSEQYKQATTYMQAQVSSTTLDYAHTAAMKTIGLELPEGLTISRLRVYLGGGGIPDQWSTMKRLGVMENGAGKVPYVNWSNACDISSWRLLLMYGISMNSSSPTDEYIVPIRAVRLEAFY